MKTLSFFPFIAAMAVAYFPFHDYETSNMHRNICQQDDSVEAKCLFNSTIYNVSRATLRIRNGYNNVTERPYCTAWLVGDQGHVLTNYHCFRQPWLVNVMRFEAMAEGETCETDCRSSLGCPGKIIHSKPLTFIKSGGSTKAADYALLQLPLEDRQAAVSTYGYLKLRRSGPVLDERVYVPQHPQGWGKRIAMKDGDNWARILDLNGTDYNGCGNGQVIYKVDTRGGSSGSPVLGVSDNAVVALHHCGGCSKFGIGNSGVHIQVLLDGLQGLLPDSAYV